MGLAWMLGGCELINPDEPVPGYLRIEKFTYDASAVGASATSSVSDAWIFVNDQFLGAFELPATVPVLLEGETKVELRPGIFSDGRRSTRFYYPFYNVFPTTVTLHPGQTQSVRPQTSVNLAHTTFHFSEDFQNGVSDMTITQATAGTYAATIVQSPSGADSLLLTHLQANPRIGVVYGKPGIEDPFYWESSTRHALPQRGTLVFAELDYRSTMPFKVGVNYFSSGSASGTRIADLTIFPKREWSKIYVDLTDEVSFTNDSNAEFKLSIQGLPTGEAGQYLAIDNVRLLSYKN